MQKLQFIHNSIDCVSVLTVLRFKLSSTCSMAFSKCVVSSCSTSLLDSSSASNERILQLTCNNP